MTKQGTSLPAYRADVDGLRGLAVLAVVVYHAFPGWLPGGFIGVDCFFVISGYLITRDICARSGQHGFSIAGFYRRRVHRLFPALLPVLLACMLIGELMLFQSEQQVLLSDTVASAAFVQNMWLWHNAGYFDTLAALRPLLHLWSLAVEEQFYLLWPWLLMLFLPLRSAWRLTIAVALLSFCFGLWLLPRDSTGAYYWLPARAWQILAGAAVALTPRWQWPTTRAAASPMVAGGLAAMGVALLLAGLVLAKPGDTYPGWMALLPTLGTAALLVEGPPTVVSQRLLGHRWLVGLGLISYPLYLWHWPLLAFTRIDHAGSPGAVLRMAVLALAGLLAWATWRFAERRWRPLGSPRKTAMLAGALVLVAALALALAQWRAAEHLIASDTQARLADIGLVRPVTPEPAADCDPARQRALPQISRCQQSGPRPPTSAVIGDSHAQHLFAGLQQVDPDTGWLGLTISSCPPLLGVHVRLPHIDCGTRPDAMLRQVAADTSIKRVVLGFLGSYALDTNVAAEHVLAGMGPAQVQMTDHQQPGADKPQAMFNGLQRTVALLESAGKSVVIMLDVPEWPFQPRDCIRRPLLGQHIVDCSISRAAVLQRQAMLRAMVARIQALHPRTQVFDPMAVLCDAERCALEQQGVLTMRDSHHLSARGSALVARQLLRDIQPR